jgi:hypothetical protein
VKFTLSWLKDHLAATRQSSRLMIGLEVEHVEDKAKLLKPFTIAKVVSAEQHPNADRCGSAWSIPATAPRCRSSAARRMRAHGLKSVFARPAPHSGQGHHARPSAISAASKARACCARPSWRSRTSHRRHHRPAGGCARRQPYADLCRARRSGDRDQPDAEPPGLHLDLRHCPRSRRRRPRHVEEARIRRSRAKAPPVKVKLDLAPEDEQSLPRLRAAPRARRQERPFAGMAAAAADSPSAFVRSMRWSTSPTT